MAPNRSRRAFSFTLFAASLAAVALQAQDDGRLRPFTAGEGARIETAVLEAEAVRAAARTERVRVLAVTPVEADKDERVRPGYRVLAEVVLVTYASSRGLRVRVDIDSGRIVATESLPGRPQASGAERDEGERLVRSDEALGKLLEGNRLVGGFA